MPITQSNTYLSLSHHNKAVPLYSLPMTEMEITLIAYEQEMFGKWEGGGLSTAMKNGV